MTYYGLAIKTEGIHSFAEFLIFFPLSLCFFGSSFFHSRLKDLMVGYTLYFFPIFLQVLA